jgi:hypothetical protein
MYLDLLTVISCLKRMFTYNVNKRSPEFDPLSCLATFEGPPSCIIGTRSPIGNIPNL